VLAAPEAVPQVVTKVVEAVRVMAIVERAILLAVYAEEMMGR
jgi:hypothetical protein